MKCFRMRKFAEISCLAAISGLVILTGCRQQSHDAAVRLINAAPGSQNVSAAIDGQVVWKHSKFGSNTGYRGIKAGSYKIDINADPADSGIVKHSDLECVKGKAYTVVNFGKTAGLHGSSNLRIFVGALKAPIPRDKARIQFINATRGVGRVDVLFDSIVGFANVPVGSRSAPTMLNSGAYHVQLNKANQLQTFSGPLVLHFLPGRSYTLVAMGAYGAAQNGLSLKSFSDSR